MILTGRFRFKLYLALLIVFTAVLVVLSLRSFSSPPQFFSSQDKIGHFLAYAFTSWLACQVLGNRLNRVYTLVLSFLYASVTGAVLELLQVYFTTYRQGEWADIAANLLGALAGCVIYSLRQLLKNNKECDETDTAA
jgi:VanZ family protein